MHVVMFYHSLISDWNHGNAHFLRGVACELLARGHRVSIYEPHDGWSLNELRREQGQAAIEGFFTAYPSLSSQRYSLETLDLDRVLDDADLVIAHEWNAPALIQRLGAQRQASRRFRLLFHDTHHRSVTAPDEMAGYDLQHFDGALVFGQVIKEIYQRRGWCERTWVWHEAADTRVFHPLPDAATGELVWIGNWGDDERSQELHEFLIEPAKALGISGCVYGVRYPLAAKRALDEAGLAYAGWLPNYEAPSVYARFRATLHVPRRPYVRALPGIPTIRVFEALACGIPLICAPWDDAEHLFSPGDDYLIARDGKQMEQHLRAVLSDRELALQISEHGRRTVLARHTCAHRVDELLELDRGLGRGLAA
jgi:spore maturation protein CgeB